MSAIFRYSKEEHMRTLAHLDTNIASQEGRGPHELEVEHDLIKDVERFWSPSPSPIEVDEDAGFLKVVATDISMSLREPSPILKSDPAEFKKQARVIKRDIRRLSTCSKKHAKHKGKNHTLPGERHGRRSTEHLEYQQAFLRRLAIEDGRDFLLDFLRYHFEDHLDSITIKSKKTLEEIKMIGNEELSVGVRQCRRLFNAPVLSDKVGLLLWTELRKGDSLDHSHAFRSDNEALKEGVSREEAIKKRTDNLEERLAEYIEAQKLLACAGGDNTDPVATPKDQNLICYSTIGQTETNDPLVTKELTVARTPIVSAAAARKEAPVATAPVQHGSSSILMERKAVDGFLKGMKQRTAKGVIYFAASLAAGYV